VGAPASMGNAPGRVEQREWVQLLVLRHGFGGQVHSEEPHKRRSARAIICVIDHAVAETRMGSA